MKENAFEKGKKNKKKLTRIDRIEKIIQRFSERIDRFFRTNYYESSRRSYANSRTQKKSGLSHRNFVS